MRINYRRHRQAIESLYTDTADIYRYEDVKDPNTGVDRKELVLKYEDQPCRISQRALATMNQTDAQNNILYETKLFIAPELALLQGDLIKAIRGKIANGEWIPVSPARKYEIGEPFLYPTHQEVSMQRREWA